MVTSVEFQSYAESCDRVPILVETKGGIESRQVCRECGNNVENLFLTNEEVAPIGEMKRTKRPDLVVLVYK